jgi:hypothetical protein
MEKRRDCTSLCGGTLYRFSDADDLTTRHGGRRPKTASSWPDRGPSRRVSAEMRLARGLAPGNIHHFEDRRAPAGGRCEQASAQLPAPSSHA